MSVCTREMLKLSDSSEGHGSLRVCLGTVVCEHGGVSGEKDNVLAPRKLIRW